MARNKNPFGKSKAPPFGKKAGAGHDANKAGPSTKTQRFPANKKVANKRVAYG